MELSLLEIELLCFYVSSIRNNWCREIRS